MSFLGYEIHSIGVGVKISLFLSGSLFLDRVNEKSQFYFRVTFGTVANLRIFM